MLITTKQNYLHYTKKSNLNVYFLFTLTVHSIYTVAKQDADVGNT